jgi:hypothetical protein
MKKTVIDNTPKNTEQSEQEGKGQNKKSAVGGSAAERGLDFQARVIAITMIYLLSERKIIWLSDILNDVPCLVDAETGGPGDDISLLTKNGKTVEIQVKRGLRSGADLWDALNALVQAIHKEEINSGVLVVCPNSSATIRTNLAENIIRIGTGRKDGLHKIGHEFVKKSGLNIEELTRVCNSLRIITVAAVEGNNSEETNAINQLQQLFCEPYQAWGMLVEHARKLIRIRGRVTISSLLNEFRLNSLDIKTNSTDCGIQLRATISKWFEASYSQFSIPGQIKPVSLKSCWIPLKTAVIKDLETFPDDLSQALVSYHSYSAGNRHSSQKFDACTLGRYVTKGIIIGGPGIGKSMLLRRIGLEYASECYLVLLASLTRISSLINHKGIPFEEALVDVALSGSGLTYRSVDLQDAVILCDGLDECGSSQKTITDALHRFAVAHPKARILLTSRPVGYQPGLLAEWRHYELLPLEDSQADEAVTQVMAALNFDSSEARSQAQAHAKEQMKSQHLKGVATRSPLILTMLASLSSKGIEPGSSRSSLYRQLFKLLESFPSTRSVNSLPTAADRDWFINLLGWVLLEHGTEPFDTTSERCISEWQNETQGSRLDCMNKVDACFNYWESVGAIERIHTLDQEAVTFVHKTFAEYAAAVFIKRQPHNAQRDLLIKVIRHESKRETLSFASHLGLVQEILDVWSELIVNGDTAATKGLREAHKIIIEAGLPVTTDSLGVFADCCWKAATSSISLFNAGDSLCQIAEQNWDIVRDHVTSNLNSQDGWLWLVVWGCFLTGSPDEVSYHDAVTALNSIKLKWPKRLQKGNSIFDFISGQHVKNCIVLGAAKVILRNPEEAGLAVLTAIIDKGRGVSTNCLLQLLKLYQDAGIELENEVSRYSFLNQDFMNAYDVIDRECLNFLSLLADEYDVSDQNDILPERMIELGAFMTVSGFHQLSLSGLHRLGCFNEDAVYLRIFLYQVARSVGLEPEKLKYQAAMLKKHGLSNQLMLNSYFFRLPVVDIDLAPERVEIDESDFDSLCSLILLDQEYYSVLAAFVLHEHISHPRVLECIEKIIMRGHGIALHLAVELIKDMSESKWQEFILHRLETSVPDKGCSYLYDALISPFDLRHEEIAKQGLRNESVHIAIAAAKFSTKLPPSKALLIELRLIYEDWKQLEKPSPDGIGIISDSPRDVLAQILMQNVSQDDVELILEMVQEKRSPIRNAGEKALLGALAESVDLQQNLTNWVSEGACKGKLLGKIISNINLNAKTVMELVPFLKHQSAELRFACMALLNRRYLNNDQIEMHARELLTDTEVEIRENALSVLSSLALNDTN